MTESMHWCLVLLINVLSRLASGTEIDTRSVCQGDAVQLFRNVAFNNGSVVTIYINGVSQKLIGTGNSLSTFSIISEYKGKMFIDERETFWLLKIQRSDEQKYVLRTQIDTKITKVEAQIFVMVTPTKHCRPKLLKIDSALIASLESNECGYPTASVKWLDYPGISYMDKSTVKLPSGKESGTYYACAESHALKCVTDFNISDYCSSIVVETNNSPAVSPGNTQVSSEVIVIIVILILILFLLVVLITIHLLLYKRKKDVEAVSREKVLNDILACSKQGKYRPARRNDDENGLFLREMSSLTSRKQGTYRPASGNDFENEILMMKPISNRENKSVKYFDSKGSAAPMQTWIKDEQRRFVHGSKMKKGRIEGTGGVIIPLLTFGDFGDYDD